MTLNSLTALILRYCANASGAHGALRSSSKLIGHSLPRNVIKYTNKARRTRCALCGSGASCLFCISKFYCTTLNYSRTTYPRIVVITDQWCCMPHLDKDSSNLKSNIVEETILLTPLTFVKLPKTLAPPSEWQYWHVSA